MKDKPSLIWDILSSDSTFQFLDKALPTANPEQIYSTEPILLSLSFLSSFSKGQGFSDEWQKGFGKPPILGPATSFVFKPHILGKMWLVILVFTTNIKTPFVQDLGILD